MNDPLYDSLDDQSFPDLYELVIFLWGLPEPETSDSLCSDPHCAAPYDAPDYQHYCCTAN